ncbi:MAG TPA: glycosyltransferase family 39 protein [Candidatus Woesebacteria bacterium]|nr:glycosyltransferase family 39 protein [Candidatus Woesebacteria bacterium]
MPKIKAVDLLLILILLLTSVFARFYRFGQLPASLNRDEAALGYTAWSVLETGRDEWGERWPLAPASFGDYKLIGYPTLLVGLFSILPKADWVVRLPSLLAGVGLVAISWQIGRRLFNHKFGVILAVLVATSPVFIWFSRSAWEANVAVFYLITAGYLIYSALNQRHYTWRLMLGFVLLFSSIFTYNTPLILIPCLALILPLLVQSKQLKHSAIVTTVIFTLVGISFLLLSSVWSQKSGITIFTDPTVRAEWLEFRTQLSEPWQSILGNRYSYLFGRVARNFVQSFSPEFVVFRGGAHPWHSLPGFGHIFTVVYLLATLESFVLIINLIRSTYQLFQAKIKLNTLLEQFHQQYVWLYLLFVSLFPAVVTVDAPHATRSLLFFWLLCVFAVRFLWRHKNRTSLISLMLILLVFNLGYYTFHYFLAYPKLSQLIFQSDFKQVLAQVESEFPVQPVAIVDSGGYQYILLAWYLPVNPVDFLANNTRQLPDHIGLRYGEQVGRFHFIASPTDRAPAERVLVSWDESVESWQVQQFP